MVKNKNMKNNIVQKAAISTSIDCVEKKVINGMEFISLQMEEYRRYRFDENTTLTFMNPQWVFVRPSGAHTLIDLSGETHYIPNKFICLSWKNKDGVEAAEF